MPGSTPTRSHRNWERLSKRSPPPAKSWPHKQRQRESLVSKVLGDLHRISLQTIDLSGNFSQLLDLQGIKVISTRLTNHTRQCAQNRFKGHPHANEVNPGLVLSGPLQRQVGFQSVIVFRVCKNDDRFPFSVLISAKKRRANR